MKRLLLATAAIYLTAALTTAAPNDGKEIFRFDTFGDEQLWTNALQLHNVVTSLTPADALRVGLKVDVEALTNSIVSALKANAVNLGDPAVTRLLLSANAVVGVIGTVSGNTVQSIGVTCALCHSTVDNSLGEGIGRRLDGWPNRSLDVGAIIAMSPALTELQRSAVTLWKAGKFDPRLNVFDGTRIVQRYNSTEPVLIPPIYGLRNVGFETYTADGPISYWNNYVGVTQMGGHGTFIDPRPNINLRIVQTPDRVTPQLPALLDYQLSLRAPDPPRGSFNVVAAQRGRHVFNGKGGCDTCHREPAFTDVLKGSSRDVPLLHAPSETGMNAVYAARSATGEYRTTPLRGVWQHPPYFHDGSAADLPAVVNHYNDVRKLGLSANEKADLVEYLKSL